MSAPPDNPAQSVGTRKLRAPRGRRSVNPEARMPLMEHIRELRNRVLKAMLAIAVGAVLGWIFREHLVAFLRSPYSRLPTHVTNPTGIPGQHCQLYAPGLFDPLFFQLKIAIAAGIVVSAPVWMYQIWAF